MAAAFQFAQVTLAQTDGLRRDFNELVIVDKLDRAFQRQLDRGSQAHGFVSAAGANVGEFFTFERVDAWRPAVH